MKVKSGFFLYVLPAFLFAFGASYVLLELYTRGDQELYRNFFESVRGISLAKVPVAQATTTGSAEPIYGVFVWFVANMGLSKTFAISFVNAILIALVVVLLRRNGANFLLVVLAITNYYVLVLLLPAERLKFSYLFLVAAALSAGRARVVFGAAAPIAHFQTVILYVSMAAGSLVQMIVALRLSKKAAKAGFVALVLAVIAGVFLASKVIGKAQYYFEVRSISEVFQIAALTVLGVTLVGKKFTFLGVMAALIVATLFLGGDRINMIAFTYFFYAILLSGKINHPFVLLPLIYLSAKSVPFVLDIYTYGTGFP